MHFNKHVNQVKMVTPRNGGSPYHNQNIVQVHFNDGMF